MKLTLSTRLKAIFARDKEDFWFQFFTDEELELRQMDTWQLAEVISEDKVINTSESEKKRIVAEHLLNIRLSKIQAKATWWSAIILLVGAIIGASIPLLFAAKSQRQSQVNINCPDTYNCEQKTKSNPIKTTIEPEIKTPEAIPSGEAIKVILPEKTNIQKQSYTKHQKNKNAPTNRDLK